jgi:hypothetical protein
MQIKYKIHSSITLSRITDAVYRQHRTLDNPGFCLACGEEADGCEPDAQRYTCEYCDEPRVYGAEQILMMM